jgi:endonuclease VIII
MPEGPEIRRAADRIGKVLTNQIIEDVALTQPHLHACTTRLAGQTVTNVTSKGKALLIFFSNNTALYAHNQLYGRWYIKRRGQWPKTSRTLRVALHTPQHSALLYSASDISIHAADEIMLHPYLAKLGPDALDMTVNWRAILAQLTTKRFRGRSLASLYLDQGFVAGIGNYLRSEILYTARLNPTTRPKDLTRSELGRLARATLAVTRQAYSTAGVTNTPRRVAQLKARGLGRRHYRFQVFDRENSLCYVCRTPIQRHELNTRRIYICPQCQSA